jgi:hypothetical protein
LFVSVTDGDLVDHDAHLGGGAAKRLLGHGDQAQTIATTFLVIIKMLLDSDGLGSDQTLSRCTINEGGLQRVCNHCNQFVLFVTLKSSQTLGSPIMHLVSLESFHQ